MRNIITTLVVAIGLPIAAVGCGNVVADATTPVVPDVPALVATNTLAPCGGDIVTVSEGAPVGCDVIPPQRLDVVMSDRLNTVHDCLDMGGEFVPVVLVCQGVDY